MYLTVKYGLVRIIYQKEDLCDQLKNNVDQDCPVGPGPVKFTKEVDIPAQVPPVNSRYSQFLLSKMLISFTGKIYRSGRCFHQGRRQDHLPQSRNSVQQTRQRRVAIHKGRHWTSGVVNNTLSLQNGGWILKGETGIPLDFFSSVVSLSIVRRSTIYIMFNS